MNYQHAFHAGNHADVLKHVVLLAVCDALTVKPAACFALDTHAGAGVYHLGGEQARRTGEADDGIRLLLASAPRQPLITRYLSAVAACRAAHGADAYPGSPWLLAHALRDQDRIACCETESAVAGALRHALRADDRVSIHAGNGYAAMKALLPPRHGPQRFNRGLVLIDPPYEAQAAEFDIALKAMRDALARWPQGIQMLWYPIKQRRTLTPFVRAAAKLQTKASLLVELLVRADDSPLRMNGSGLLILDPPWQLATALAPALEALRGAIGEAGADTRLHWIREPA